MSDRSPSRLLVARSRSIDPGTTAPSHPVQRAATFKARAIHALVERGNTVRATALGPFQVSSRRRR